MGLLQFMGDIFGSKDRIFERLSLSHFFSEQRAKLFSDEEYAKWLKSEYVTCISLCMIEIERGNKIPQKWHMAIKRIEDEYARLEATLYFPPLNADGEKSYSAELKEKNQIDGSM